MNASHANVDSTETAKFDQLAAGWWDRNGDSRALHDLNPVRLDYVAQRSVLRGARVLDVGCGGGILSEALAGAGADVMAIDLATRVLDVARLHLHESGQQVDYRQVDVESLATQMPESFDVVTCMEMLEHVPDPGGIIGACAKLLKPGGKLFLSTLTRTPLAFAGAIVAAEYMLRLLPRGTHDYARFIRPSELTGALRDAGMQLQHLSGLAYNPLTRRAALTREIAINYLACAQKPE